MPTVIKNTPVEIFGHYTEAPLSQSTKRAFTAYHCPFLDSRCKKFRKSTPEIKIGTCTLGYQSRPVIICPHRFDSPEVFDAIIRRFIIRRRKGSVKWVKEVALGKSGSVDYVAAVCVDGEMQDFLCVEFQAAGTTGTPWQAVEEYKMSGSFTQDSYHYGINWANQYLKTMMQQVLKKGKVVSQWNRKIIFVLQDVGMDYILRSGGGIECQNDSYPVQFFPFKMVLDNSHAKWNLRPTGKIYSATLAGVERILSGSEDVLSVEKFIENIHKKGAKDGVF